MGKKEIYVVTEGSYSDYHICGVFTDKEKAENFVNIYNRFSGEYAEIETYEDGVMLNNNGIKFTVCFHRDEHDNLVPFYSRTACQSERCGVRAINGYIEIIVFAETKALAEKIAKDKLAEWLAERKEVL